MNAQRDKAMQLRTQVAEMVAMAASEVGGLTQAEADRWWDEISDGIMDGFEGVITDLGCVFDEH